MSLIDDALRRIQDPVSADKKTPSAPVDTSGRGTSQKDKKQNPAHSWSIEDFQKNPAAAGLPVQKQKPNRFTAVAVLLGLVAVLLWVFAIIAFKPFDRPLMARRQPMKAQPGLLQSNATNNSSVPATAEVALKLSGVVLGNGEPYAVIDGKILAVGEMAGEAKILGIAENAVTLELPGKKTKTLQVPR